MNTKKFEVQFDSAKAWYGSVEMKAKVDTDATFHFARMRVGSTDEPVIWADMGRTYTPQQLHHVKELLNYHLPIVKEAIDKWLTSHNFSSCEEMMKADKRFRIQLNSNCVVEHFEYGR